MTAKDQAIAPTKIEAGSGPYFALLGAEYGYNFLRGDEYRQMQEYSRKVWDAAKAQPPAPDCRTCEHVYQGEFGYDCDSALCTNGDQYQPAPKVVLWRKE